MGRDAPKTLVFLQIDSHADVVYKIIREEFDEGVLRETSVKVTYKAEEDSKSVLRPFQVIILVLR
jgi:type I site-specific restriction endonuclease